MEKRLVQVGNVLLGSGQPAVCIPVMGTNMQAIAKAAQAADAALADVIELRADGFSPMPSLEEAAAMCRAVRAAAPKTALLFTLRTLRDGGAGADDAAAYEAVLSSVIDGGYADAVDVELSAGDAYVRLCHLAKEKGIPVVGSCHHFEGTPEEDEIFDTLVRMARLGADVSKIAVMPRSRMDLLTLMRAAVRADEACTAPIVAISMGAQGMLSRIGAQMIGSCLTFGTAGQASAPGQLDAKTLRHLLEIIHNT